MEGGNIERIQCVYPFKTVLGGPVIFNHVIGVTQVTQYGYAGRIVAEGGRR